MKIFSQIKADGAFLKKTKLVYLENFRKKFPEGQKNWLFLNVLKVSFAAMASIAVIISVSAVYADQKNVGADNMLYPMKRIYESVKLDLAAKTEKPLLQLKFADRRLHEIEDASKKNPKDPKVANLVKDLQKSTEESITALNYEEKSEESEPTATSTRLLDDQKNFTAPIIINSTTSQPLNAPKKEKQRAKNKKRTSICESFNDFFANDSARLGELLETNPELWKKFKNNCEPLIGSEKIIKSEEKKQENIKKAEELNKEEVEEANEEETAEENETENKKEENIDAEKSEEFKKEEEPNEEESEKKRDVENRKRGGGDDRRDD